jgi:putative endonuclease
MTRLAGTRAERGASAERAAATLLEGAGLRIVARNYRARGGELDLVARERDQLVFVEVRQRSCDAYGGGAASITAAKRARLMRAAQQYLAETRQPDAYCRFDAVLVDGDGRCTWLRGAFDAD